MTTFGDLRTANIIRAREWTPEGVPLTFRSTELAGETGEACNIVKKLERERLGLRGSRASVADLAQELADVVICCDLIATDMGICLGDAVRDKFNVTSEKYNLTTKL